MAHRHCAPLLILLSAAAAGLLFFLASTQNERSPITSFLRTNPAEAEEAPENRRLLSVGLAQFTDPRSVSLRTEAPLVTDAPEESASPAPPSFPEQPERPREQFAAVDFESRANCQIVYILGVEGATHHGFLPIIESLARNQVDPRTGQGYVVDVTPQALKAGLFGWFYSAKIKRWGFEVTPEVDDPAFVQTVVRESCPNDGKKHILIEWASFPSGHEDDPRTYRVHRQHEWMGMSPEEIANSDEALEHPTNMQAFYQAYSPYVDIKFVVLHRPFLETIASHRDWDGGPEIHSNIIRGFMLMLRRFLDTHLFDLVDGTRLWSLVCVEKIMSKHYGSEHEVKAARKRVLSYLTEFLRWPDGDCPQCFDDWKESTKDPREVLGVENVSLMMEHKKFLEGIWPPPGDDGNAEQQCGI